MAGRWEEAPGDLLNREAGERARSTCPTAGWRQRTLPLRGPDSIPQSGAGLNCACCRVSCPRHPRGPEEAGADRRPPPSWGRRPRAGHRPPPACTPDRCFFSFLLNLQTGNRLSHNSTQERSRRSLAPAGSRVASGSPALAWRRPPRAPGAQGTRAQPPAPRRPAPGTVAFARR